MTKAEDLIARLEAAEVGTWDLDREIAELADGRERLFEEHREESPHWRWRWETPDGWTSGGWSVAIPRYTDSLDSAMALKGRLLPDWIVQLDEWEADILRAHGPWQAILTRRGERDQIKGVRCDHAPTPALALCIAILRALQEQPHD